jgi:hypothetical protein
MAIKRSCHCGAVQFEAPEPTELTSCNGSHCGRVGALCAYCTPDQFRLLTVPERRSSYQFGGYIGVHHHCAVCGCATHGHINVHDDEDDVTIAGAFQEAIKFMRPRCRRVKTPNFVANFRGRSRGAPCRFVRGLQGPSVELSCSLRVLTKARHYTSRRTTPIRGVATIGPCLTNRVSIWASSRCFSRWLSCLLFS